MQASSPATRLHYLCRRTMRVGALRTCPELQTQLISCNNKLRHVTHVAGTNLSLLTFNTILSNERQKINEQGC